MIHPQAAAHGRDSAHGITRGLGGRRARAGWRALLATLAATVALAGCGGGGGGGDGGGASDFRVTLDRTSVAFSYDAGSPPAPAFVLATATGTPPATLYVGAVVEGTGIDPVIPAVIGGTTARFQLQPAPGLRAGTYTGRVLLSACSDPACNTRIGGTPLAVTYSVVVRPVLAADPAGVQVTVTGGAGAQRRVAILLPAGASGYTVAGAADAAWLRATPSTDELVLDFLPWRSGLYNVNLQVQAGSASITLPVFYRVDVPPGGERDLAVDPASLTLATTEGAATPPRDVVVTPATWAGGQQPALSVRYPAGAPTGWLQATATSGGASVRADATSLTQGSYTATLVFTPALPGTVRELPVALTVGPGLVRPADWTVTVQAETTAAALSGSAAVQVAQGPDRAWTATSDQPWLRLTTASGSTAGGAVAWAIDPTGLAALANFETHSATVTLRADTPAYTPVSFRVVVDKRLPEVRWVGPATVVTGRSTLLSVRGRGFDAVSDPNRLATGATPRGTVARISDTELQVLVSPGSASTNSVAMGNALGLPPAAATLQILAPRSHAYAAVASAGVKRSIVFDAARQALYAANVEGDTLVRLRFDGSSWVLDATPVPAILDVGLAPDNASLIVTATPGRVRLLDPASLATTFSLDVPEGLSRDLTYQGFGIATTNDGFSWLPAGRTGWNELVRFDHATRRIVPRPPQPDLRTSFYGGPWAMVSRDGANMVVVQSGSLSPSPPALVWRASDGLLRDNGAGLQFFYDASWSDDGSRIVIDNVEVRDRELALVGRARLDGVSGGPWIVRSSVMSPDGRRTYLLADTEAAITGGASGPMRVFVFDSSTRDPATVALPLVGDVALADAPGCRRLLSGDCPNHAPRMAIAPDGQTLFIAGNERLLVVPVPEALRAAGSSAELRARALNTVPPRQPWVLPAAGRR